MATLGGGGFVTQPEREIVKMWLANRANFADSSWEGKHEHSHWIYERNLKQIYEKFVNNSYWLSSCCTARLTSSRGETWVIGVAT